MTNTDKYELVEHEGLVRGYDVLHRIRALRSFVAGNGKPISLGDFGGYVRDFSNLSQEGSCWVDGDAEVSNGAAVREDAVVTDNAVVGGLAVVKGRAVVSGNARVTEDAVISGYARVRGSATVEEGAKVTGHAEVGGKAVVTGRSSVCHYARLDKDAKAGGCAVVGGTAWLVDGFVWSSDDYICVTPAVFTAGSATLNLTTNTVVSGDFDGSLDEYLARGHTPYCDSHTAAMMLKLAAETFKKKNV